MTYFVIFSYVRKLLEILKIITGTVIDPNGCAFLYS